jgi:hypothetical protein
VKGLLIVLYGEKIILFRHRRRNRRRTYHTTFYKGTISFIFTSISLQVMMIHSLLYSYYKLDRKIHDISCDMFGRVQYLNMIENQVSSFRNDWKADIIIMDHRKQVS